MRCVPAPATCKAGGLRRQLRLFQPRRPVPLRHTQLRAATSSAGLSLDRSCAQLRAVASSAARLRATPPGIPSAALPRPPCRSPCGSRRWPRGGFLSAHAARAFQHSPLAFGGLIMLNLVKVAPPACGLQSVKIAHREMLKCAVHRRIFRLSSASPPPLIRLRSAWRIRGIYVPSPSNF